MLGRRRDFKFECGIGEAGLRDGEEVGSDEFVEAFKLPYFYFVIL
jgi:hypothetical protein